ncbi:MAG: aminoglycoside phosphotransferase family protein [Anaerolineales bacterium]|nr:aminoglycoside phosphotransferase family protein [Anaerolineales bacterium]
MNVDIAEIAHYFEFEGDFVSARPYGNGHINNTYAAIYHIDGESHRYILQRINHHVFGDPESLMENIEVVTAHLQNKIINAGGDSLRETLTLIPTRDGDSFVQTEEGHYWRAYIFIENARTYEVVEDKYHAYTAAVAFGNFQSRLMDLQSDILHETIPNFHNTKNRYETFLQAVAEDECNLASSSKAEIEFVMKRADDVSVLVDLYARGELPERVTHNDTKFNNVLIDDETGEGICIIDLDTVMPGLSLYDFGDSIRSMANPAPEDEGDLSKVQFDMEVFDHFSHGYLDAARVFLTPLEIEYLPFSAILMTFECGMRFLVDHLQGDVYYKIHRENQNLDRSRTQFKLVQDMEEQFDEMARTIEKHRP